MNDRYEMHLDNTNNWNNKIANEKWTNHNHTHTKQVSSEFAVIANYNKMQTNHVIDFLL